jgi:hypothetical protein
MMEAWAVEAVARLLVLRRDVALGVLLVGSA